MINKSKKYTDALKVAQKKEIYELREAIDCLLSMKTSNFDETVEVVFRLGIDAKKTDQIIRGAVVMPHGIGKEVRVLVFAKGELADRAKAAGADFVGGDELVDKVAQGWLDFDAVIATPDTMKSVGKLGKTLGTKGLMPTPKKGTVTDDVEKAVTEAKAGRVEFRNDKTGNLHCIIGKKSFQTQKLYDNCMALIDSVNRVKPAMVKGALIKKCSISSSMSPGLRVDEKAFAH